MLSALGSVVKAALGVPTLRGSFELDKDVYFPGDTVLVPRRLLPPLPPHSLRHSSNDSSVGKCRARN